MPILQIALRCLLASAAITLSAAVHAAAPQPSEIVETRSGKVQGLVEDGVSVFKGIPYGAPPIAELRFKAPQPAAAWPQVLDATGFGAPAIQMYDRELSGADIALQLATVFTTRSEMKIDNEDCLFLNVWTPAPDSEQRPVMVWIHGGGYAYGSGSWPVYDGANLARKGDAVVVTVNHRLNVFGYLHLADIAGPAYADSGNAGMLDLVLALQWVRDNITAFGGDPGNVTIMGESGGGSKVSTLMAMPAANGLFHKAIIQSGPGLTGVPQERATQSARAILAELDVGENVERLQAVPAQKLLDAALAAAAKAGGPFGGLPLAPVVDGRVLPRDPFTPDAPAQSRDIPVLIGFNKDEWTIFTTGEPWFGTLSEAELPAMAEAVAGPKAEALLDAYRRLHPDYTPTYIYSALLGDLRMLHGSVLLAERKAAQQAAPVYMYYLTWETPVAGGLFKSPHTLEIPFMFNNVDKAVALTGDGAEARRLEDRMSSTWIAFARTGDPNNDTIPQWPRYDPDTRPALVFDTEVRVEQDPKREIREILQAP